MPNIGEVLAQEEENAPQQDMVGQALTQPIGSQPTPEQQEIMQRPDYQKIKRWALAPENMMTGLVFLASLAQNRRKGQSSLAALGERAVGSLAYRHDLGKSARDEQRTIAEEGRKTQALEAETGFRQGQLDVQREGVGVQREQVAATKENTAAEIAGREAIYKRGDATDRYIAELRASTDEKLGEMQLSLKELEGEGLMNDNDVTEAMKLVTASMDAGTPVTYGEAIAQVLRPKLLLTRPDLLEFFEKGGNINPTTVTPTPSATKPVRRGRPEPEEVDMRPAGARLGSAVIGALPKPGYGGTAYSPGKPKPKDKKELTFEELEKQRK